MALFRISGNRKLPNYLLPVATKPQIKEIQPYFNFLMVEYRHIQRQCCSSLLGLYKCVVTTVYRDTPPSACSLLFWLHRDVSGCGEGAFPAANDSTQARLRALRSTATGRHSDHRKLQMRVRPAVSLLAQIINFSVRQM